MLPSLCVPSRELQPAVCNLTLCEHQAFWDDLAISGQPWQGIWWQFTSTGIVVGVARTPRRPGSRLMGRCDSRSNSYRRTSFVFQPAAYRLPS